VYNNELVFIVLQTLSSIQQQLS